MIDDPRQVAFNGSAPQGERFDAMSELQKGHRPLASQLLPPEDLRPVIQFINEQMEESALAKATMASSFGAERRGPAAVTRSLLIDPMKTWNSQEYYEKPTSITFAGMRSVVEQTPVLSAVIRTRIRQISRFTQISEDGGLGFEIRHKDRNTVLKGAEAEKAKELARFFLNCGWEFNPRRRKILNRDNFTQFMAKSVRDTLMMDACPIETEMRRNRQLGIDGLYAIDGASIRLCAEQGYNGDDAIFALQVAEGRVTATYDHEQLIYEVRNPRTDLDIGGYGQGEVELMIKVVTGFLNAMTYNSEGFDNNSIPKGMLSLIGDYSSEDIAAFRRYWRAQCKGIQNTWGLPIMVAQDPQSKATFQKFDAEFSEMHFSKWMTFLTSIICAIFGMSPDEINFESFSASKSALSGSDTETRLESSKDLGLRPLMSFYESMFSDFIVAAFNDDWCFRWIGMDGEDPAKKAQEDTAVMTVNEMRARRGDPPFPDPELGDAPLNPGLVSPWMTLRAKRGPAEGPEDAPDDQTPPPAAKPAPADDEGAVSKSLGLGTIYTLPE